MNSNECPERLDLDRGLPTTAEDVAALKRLRADTKMDLGAYLQFLAQFPAPGYDELRARKGPRGIPFSLA